QVHSTDEMLDIAIDRGLSTKLFERGSKVIITAGVPVGESGTTNLMKVHVIGDVIANGQGIGRRSAYGKAGICKDAKEAVTKVNAGDIIVKYGRDREMMRAIERAGVIITEEGGLTSQGAVVALGLGIPAIVGVQNLSVRIQDGADMSIDGAKV